MVIKHFSRFTRLIRAISPTIEFANGFKHKPDTTFGTVNAEVLVDSEPGFKPLNFVEIIRKSPWVS